MRIDTQITLYGINRCGYYPRGSQVPAFGGVARILSELKEWSRGKSLNETRTFDPTGGELEPTYLFDIREAPSGNYLLTTWNEVPASDGAVAVVPGNAAVGKVSVSLTPIPRGSIPGYVTYFWFVPSRDKLATVTARNPRNGRENLSQYLQEFVSKFTSFVRAHPGGPGEPDIVIDGYSRDDSEPPANLIPTFQTSQLKKRAEIDLVRENRERIIGIIRKNRLNPRVAPERKFWDSLLTDIGIFGKPIQVAPVKIKYEVPYTPSEAELEEILARWQERGVYSGWEDVGFRFRGSSTIVWLNHAIAREKWILEVGLTESGVFEPASLLDTLEKAASRILASLA